jgi:molecular chaperone Hsp33
MNKKDLIQRFIFENHDVRGEWVRLDQTYQTIVQQHPYNQVLKHLLGELLVITSLLSAIVKFKGRLTVQFQAKNKLKLLMAQCDDSFHLRGLAQWDGEIESQELPELFKGGQIAVTIDPSKGGSRYQGIVEWTGSTLAQSIEGYFKNSEQLPTRLWIAVDEKSAAGLLLQMLPRNGSKPEIEDSSWEHLLHLTNTITPQELMTLDAATLLSRLYVEEEVRIFPPEVLKFKCNCSIERCENVLLMVGKEEVEQELHDKQQVDVVCEFCNKEFIFDRVDIARIFSKGDKPPSSSQLH